MSIQYGAASKALQLFGGFFRRLVHWAIGSRIKNHCSHFWIFEHVTDIQEASLASLDGFSGGHKLVLLYLVAATLMFAIRLCFVALSNLLTFPYFLPIFDFIRTGHMVSTHFYRNHVLSPLAVLLSKHVHSSDFQISGPFKVLGVVLHVGLGPALPPWTQPVRPSGSMQTWRCQGKLNLYSTGIVAFSNLLQL